jgi:tripartite-type tricarboxylate transporter receptor subunit TctC
MSRFTPRNTVIAAGYALLLLLVVDVAHAQAYPTRPIRFVVPYAAGGGVDFVGRAIAQKLAETWNHSVIVDNRPGGGTNIGSEMVARSAPDGYTLLVASVPNSVNMTLYKKLGYDVIKDFTPVVQISTAPIILVVHPSVPARSVKELIALAKLRPGQLTYASAGFGSSNHLAGELFKMLVHVDIVHVPYKGGSAAVTDLIGGQVSMYFGTTPSTAPHVHTGRLRALGVTSAKRSPIVPEVPTIAESGVPGYEQSTWHGLLAPTGTPEPIIAKLNSEIVRFLHQPSMVERLGAQGVDVIASSPGEFAAFIRRDVVKYQKLLKVADVRVE